MHSTLTILTLAMTAAPTPPQEAAAAPALVGRLVHTKPLDFSGVEVRLWSTSGAGSYRSTKVARDGAFRFEPGPVGSARLLVDNWVDGAGVMWSAAQVVGSEDRGAVVLALVAGALLHGRVSDELLDPPSGFQVRLYRGFLITHHPGPLWAEIPADATGAFAAVLPPGAWHITGQYLATPDRTLAPEMLRLPHAGEVRLHLPLPVRVAGRVVDERGQPVSGASVDLVSTWDDEGFLGWGGTAKCTTDEHGRFEDRSLQPSRLTLHASKPGHAPSADVVHVLAAGQAAEGVLLQLRRPSTLEISLLDAASTGATALVVEYLRLPDLEPQLDSHGLSRVAGRVEFDGVGVARESNLPPGTYEIEAITREQSGQRRFLRTIELREGGTSALVFGGPEPAPIDVRGTVRTASGDACPDTIGWIDLSRDGRLRWNFTPDAKGTWECKLPFAARYRVEVMLGAPGDVCSTPLIWSLDLGREGGAPVTLLVPTGRVNGRLVIPNEFVEEGAFAEDARGQNIMVERVDGAALAPNVDRRVHCQVKAGKFEIHWLPAGTYRISIADHFSGPNGSFEQLSAVAPAVVVKESGQPAEITLTLAPVPATVRLVR